MMTLGLGALNQADGQWKQRYRQGCELMDAL